MKILLIHNIATSYYKNIVFNEFYKIYKNFKVLHLAETEKIRDWKIDLSDIEYPYEVLVQGSIDNKGKLYYIKKIWQLLNNENPKILYLGGYFHIAFWTALIWAKIHSVKIILEMDSNKFDHVRVEWKEYIKKIFVSNCTVGITYGELSRAYFQELGMSNKKIIIKPNVSSKTLFYKSNLLEKPNCMIIDNYFIYVGRFSKEKNLLLFLNAFNDAYKKLKTQKWGILLVGSGPQEEELKEYISKFNIPNVTFSGFVDKNDLVKYYNYSKVFVLPSTSEPWGLVANEAMMSGLPVIISTQCGCSLDLVQNNGFTFNPFNKLELEKILMTYMMEEVNINEQSKESLKLIEKFTPELAAKKIYDAITLIEEIK
ncbi:glycosyltransferase family 4 protein [Arcobacter arenosus]|uniref:glycosyltransferase family 4 protein n=1 Tax=Arcobacter arenosus TaxID=2576037 RepID=UPI003BACFF95